MSEKRRDNKGRLLRPNESQRADGRYEYRYLDNSGKKHSVYSWKLVTTDRAPKGKRSAKALRELESEISKMLTDAIDPSASKRTLNYYSDIYCRDRLSRRESTVVNNMLFYNKHVRNTIGTISVNLITYSDLSAFLRSLHDNAGLEPGSIKQMAHLLSVLLDMSVKDRAIAFNPMRWVSRDISRLYANNSDKKHALTIDQQVAFMKFCNGSGIYKKWVPMFTVLLGTGCRIGEALGLRWDDCDFNAGTISINHTLAYYDNGDGKCRHHIHPTKTRSGVRVIPMLSEVKEALIQIRREQAPAAEQIVVDGYTNFVFLTKTGHLYQHSGVNQSIDGAVRAYNKQIAAEHSFPSHRSEPLPKISAHTFRHTFCTRLCENEQNVKLIQDIMGHSDINTTMNIYNEIMLEFKTARFNELEGKLLIGATI